MTMFLLIASTVCGTVSACAAGVLLKRTLVAVWMTLLYVSGAEFER